MSSAVLGIIATLAWTVLPFVLSPGASFTLTISAVARRVPSAGLMVGVGTACGVGLIATAIGFTGLADVLARNPSWMLLCYFLGGAVLLLMALNALRAGVRLIRHGVHPTHGPQPADRPLALLGWACLTVVTNAKALGLYLLVVPTTPVNLSGMGLYGAFAATHAIMQIAWLVLVAALVARVPGRGDSPRIRIGLMLLTAVVLGILGGQTIYEGVVQLRT